MVTSLLKKLNLIFMFLILTLGSMYVVLYQNVSASEDNIIFRTVAINSNTVNGPVLNNDDSFGSSIADIGDLNGDGISDIVVGAFRGDVSGAIHVMFMNRDGTASQIVVINNNTANGPVLNDDDYFGFSVANIGDLNNDGTLDIAVGAPFDDAGGNTSGAIHIMFMNSNGSVSNTMEINNNTVNGPVLNDYDLFGSSIADIGDLNGDGISDIAVGAFRGDVSGAIHVMFMNRDGTVSQTVVINNNTANGPVLNDYDYFGRSIVNIGDLNNDGIFDIAVGAPFDDAGGYGKGTIHVMFMNRDGTISRTMEINNNTVNGPVLDNGDQFGYSIANIGDLNDDGTSDIAVGAPFDNDDGNNSGTIHVMFMNRDGTISRTMEINGNTTNGPVLNDYGFFGFSVANIGDLNNDGILDIAVGAPFDDAGGVSRGTIHVMFMNNTDRTTNINLLNNPYSLSSWTIDSNGGQGWLDISSGKTNWVTSDQTFATSYQWAEKSQIVPITSTDGTLILTEDYSKTYCGEKTGSYKNATPYDRYYLVMLLLDSTGIVIEEHGTGIISMNDSCDWSRNWHTAEIVVDSIPDDTVAVRVKHGGMSGEYWIGWYGPVMKDIKLVYQN